MKWTTINDFVLFYKVAVFKTSSIFLSTLQKNPSKCTQKVMQRKRSTVHDAFLPGYSGVQKVPQRVDVIASASEHKDSEGDVKLEERLKPDRKLKKEDSDDDFIDDGEASEEEPSSEEDESPLVKKSRGRKAASTIVKKWNEWAERLISNEEGSERLGQNIQSHKIIYISF